MIVFPNVIADFFTHFVVLLLLGFYISALLDMQKLPNVGIALIGALVITVVTHTWFPRARIQRLYA